MTKSDYYNDIIFPLPQNLKMKARIESLRFEKELYNLNIENLQDKINKTKLSIDTTDIEDLKENFRINIMEYDLKIMDYQTKMKLCDIQVLREQSNLKNYKDF